MNPSSADHSIPLLTEVIAAPAATEKTAPAPDALYWEDPPHQPAMQGQAPLQPADDAPLLATPIPAAAPTAEQLQQIRQEIQENLMQTLLGQVDNVLHQHLQDHLAVILDNMADILKTRVRASLEKALADSVTQALAEEMAKFENSKY